jgi:hypothetical protein
MAENNGLAVQLNQPSVNGDVQPMTYIKVVAEA